LIILFSYFFFSSRRRHTRSDRDWSSDVCSSDLSSVTRNRFRSSAEGKISPEDLNLFLVTDDPKETLGWIVEARERRTRAFRAMRSEERRVGKERRSRWTRGSDK